MPTHHNRNSGESKTEKGIHLKNKGSRIFFSGFKKNEWPDWKGHRVENKKERNENPLDGKI